MLGLLVLAGCCDLWIDHMWIFPSVRLSQRLSQELAKELNSRRMLVTDLLLKLFLIIIIIVTKHLTPTLYEQLVLTAELTTFRLCPSSELGFNNATRMITRDLIVS